VSRSRKTIERALIQHIRDEVDDSSKQPIDQRILLLAKNRALISRLAQVIAVHEYRQTARRGAIRVYEYRQAVGPFVRAIREARRLLPLGGLSRWGADLERIASEADGLFSDSRPVDPRVIESLQRLKMVAGVVFILKRFNENTECKAQGFTARVVEIVASCARPPVSIPNDDSKRRTLLREADLAAKRLAEKLT
jgi:hypothetical protein